MSDAYAAAGVDTDAADRGVASLVGALGAVRTGRASRALDLPGHFASVLRVGPDLGIAIGTDGVGSKLVVAEQADRLETVGVDCVAMNVNDLVCVGAEPIAMVDYLAVQEPDPGRLSRIAAGLARGAELAGIEVPGGELAVLPELLRGHPDPGGFDLCGTAIGTVALDAVITGAAVTPGDALLGLPASGLHSNGYTLARAALLGPDGPGARACPPELGGASVLDALLEPTAIYVRAIVALLDSGVPVHAVAHVTGGGLANLLRIGGDRVGYAVQDPLPVPPVMDLVRRHGAVADAEMWEVFNMGCGMAVTVPDAHAPDAVALLAEHHPGTRRIGTVTDRAGVAEAPGGVELRR